MPRATLTEELQLIESIVAAHPNGIGITVIEAEIARRKGDKPNRRTLQRRLQKLIDEQRVTTEGESIALVYKLISGSVVSANASMTLTATATAEAELYVPVSPEGAAVKRNWMARGQGSRQASTHSRLMPGYAMADL